MDSNNEKKFVDYTKLLSGDLCVGDTVHITSDKYLGLKSLFGTIKKIHNYMGMKTYRVEIAPISNPKTEDGLFIFKANDIVKINDDSGIDASVADKYNALYNAKVGVDYMKERFKEGENEMKLLEIYRDRKMDKLFKDADAAQSVAWEKDSTYKALKDLAEKTKTKDGYIFTFDFAFMPDSVRKEIDKIQKDKEEKEIQLNRLMDEVNAQLTECETYEQKINVLKTYEILDEKGKVNA